MRIDDLANAMDAIAPPSGAAAWDRTGLLVGSPGWPLARVLLAIDLTAPVLREAIDAGADACVAYHPPIFEPLGAVTDETPAGAVVLEAAVARIAVHSPHTALDAAEGGTSDWLIGGFGPGRVEPLDAPAAAGRPDHCKVVVFAPGEALEALREALAGAGAGRIGAYEQCSFTAPGTGTFLGGPDTHPVAGKPGRLQCVEEGRMEMVCPLAVLDEVVAALRSVHPYEEPAFDVHPLLGPAQPPHAGAGRIVALDEPEPLETLIERATAHLGVPRLRVAEGADAPPVHERIGACPGSGGSLLGPARAAGATCFLTGEMRHHDVLAARALGTTVLLAGHTHTERGVLPGLRDRLETALPGVEVLVSDADRAPWTER